MPLGISEDPVYIEGSRPCNAGMGVLIYTDGLTEARRDGKRLGLDAVSTALGSLRAPRRPRRLPSCASAPPSSRTAP